MLNLSHITKQFSGGYNLLRPRRMTAVDDVSLDVARGEFFSLVGESGCGKSTLSRIVSGLTSPDRGTMRIDGQDVTDPRAFRLPELRRKVQMIFQDPYSSLNPRMRIGDTLREPLVSFNVRQGRQSLDDRVSELLRIVGLPADASDRYPHQFSGGQRQRIAIARALAAEPGLLICDEPVSALDVSIKGQIVNLLLDINQRLGVTVLFISHDLSLVERISDRIAVMYLGRIVEVGAANSVFGKTRHPYTRVLIESVPSANPEQRRPSPPVGELPSPFDLPSGCRFRDRCSFAVPRCADEMPILDSDSEEHDHRTACHRQAEIEQAPMRRPVRRHIPMMELFRQRDVVATAEHQQGDM